MSVAATPPPRTPPPPTPEVVFGSASIGGGGGWVDGGTDSEPRCFPLSQMSLGMWKARSHSGLRFLLCKERFVFMVFRRRRMVSTFGRASELVSRYTSLPVPTSPFNLEGGGGAPGSTKAVTHAAPASARAGAAVDATASDATPLQGGTDTPNSAFTIGGGDTPGTHGGERTPVPMGMGVRQPVNVVLAYEVSYADVAGLDYRNPLCDDGRLAIEVRAVTKRAFPSEAAAIEFFDGLERESNDDEKSVVNRSGALRSGRSRSVARGGERRNSAVRRGIKDANTDASKHNHKTYVSPARQGGPGGEKGAGEEASARKRSRVSSISSPSLASRFEAVAPNTGVDAFMPFHVASPGKGAEGADADKENGSGAGRGKTPSGHKSKLSRLGSGSVSWKENGNSSGDGLDGRNEGEGDSTSASAAASTPTLPAVRTPRNRPGLVTNGSTGTPVFDTPKAGAFAGTIGDKSNNRPAETVFTHKTLVVHFADPLLPDALRRRVQSSPGLGLLRLYETGLPPWALFLPQYGFYYRPWLRTLARALFVLVSVLSMSAGFYDLYKHVPGLDAVFTRFWKPLGDFLERHAAARLSILASYLFTQSRMFGPVLAQISSSMRLVRSWTAAVWRPIAVALGPSAVRLWADGYRVFIGPTYAAVSVTWTAFAAATGPAVTSLKSLVPGFSFGMFGTWRALASVETAAKAGVPVVGGGLGGFGLGWIVAAVGDNASLRRNALDWWRTIGVTVLRAVQRILNFAVYLIGRVNIHRMSLGMAARRRFGGVAASAARAHGFKSGASPSASRDDLTDLDSLITGDLTDNLTASRVDGEDVEDDATSGMTSAVTAVDGHEKTE